MINIENLKKEYKQFTLDCSLQIKPGYITGIIGRNGAGKSTLFKAILNLIDIDQGTIQVNNKNIKDFDKNDKQNFGVALSDSGFSEYFTINDIISILYCLYQNFDKDDFIRQCHNFHLPMKKQIKEFSTGMKVKLKVLIAITHHAKVLILDEPTAGLDVIARDEILNMLREYMEKDNDRIILLSSHISSDLETICDDLYMIHEGKILLHEDTDILLSEYAILKVNEEQYSSLDKHYLIKVKKENYGYICLTNQKQFYLDNYKDIVIENGHIDELILMMIRGENI